MTTRTTRFVVIVGVIVVVVAAWLLPARIREPEPSYGGRTLSEVLTDIDGFSPHADRESPEFLQASNAVVQIGTNGLPLLLKWIQWAPSRDSVIVAKGLMAILSQLPDEIAREVMDRVYPSPRHRRALAAGQALEILGPELEPAIPELVGIAGSEADSIASTLATEALSAAGPAAWTEVLKLATNSGPPMNHAAARGLVPMGSNDIPAIPTLLGHLRGTNTFDAMVSARVLGKLRLEPASVVPALVQSLQSPDELVARFSAEALTGYNAKAAPALSDLAGLTHSENAQLRNSASNLIRTITAAVASEAPPR